MIRREIFSSLKVKFGVMIILIEVIVLSITGIIYVTQFSIQVDNRLISRAQIPGNLIAKGKLNYDVVRDREQLIEMIGDEPLEAMVISITQIIFYSLNSQYEGENVSVIPNVQSEWFTINTTSTLILRETFGSNNFVTVIIPVLALVDGKPYYFSYIKISANQAAIEKRNITLLFLSGSILCIISTSIVIVLSFKKMLLNRINKVVQVLKSIQNGNLASRVDEPMSKDEIGILQNGVNSMAIHRMNTEEKMKLMIENLKRSNEELTQFTYVASHDLQEPLRMVVSFTQLLQRKYKDKLDNDANDFINYIVDGATRMQGLINDLLILSRVETRGKSFNATDMNVILELVRKSLYILIKESNTKVTNDPLPVIIADDSQMVQLLQNLISNAIKFNHSEIPQVHITGEVKEKSWEFSVKDNGIGIDSQYFDRIFIIFQRLHKKNEYEGTGMGLAICKSIVQRHRGKIWVESEIGKGSTFYFSIPRQISKGNVPKNFEV